MQSINSITLTGKVHTEPIFDTERNFVDFRMITSLKFKRGEDVDNFKVFFQSFEIRFFNDDVIKIKDVLKIKQHDYVTIEGRLDLLKPSDSPRLFMQVYGTYINKLENPLMEMDSTITEVSTSTSFTKDTTDEKDHAHPPEEEPPL